MLRDALQETQKWIQSPLCYVTLRSKTLGMCLTEYPEAWEGSTLHPAQVRGLVQRRAELVATLPPLLAAARGKILCVLSEYDTAMGEGTPASRGVIDDTYLPPWDTWLGVVEVEAGWNSWADRTPDPKNLKTNLLLLAWIPDRCVEDVQAATEVAATQPIEWLDVALTGNWHIYTPAGLNTLRGIQADLGWGA